MEPAIDGTWSAEWGDKGSGNEKTAARFESRLNEV